MDDTQHVGRTMTDAGALSSAGYVEEVRDVLTERGVLDLGDGDIVPLVLEVLDELGVGPAVAMVRLDRLTALDGHVVVPRGTERVEWGVRVGDVPGEVSVYMDETQARGGARSLSRHFPEVMPSVERRSVWTSTLHDGTTVVRTGPWTVAPWTVAP